MSKVIMLDPGHDRAADNPSPVVKEYCEGRQMWRLYELLKPELEKRGFTVKGTKSRVDEAITVTQRGRMAKGCDLLISLHSNACATESVDRPVGIYFVEDGCGADEASQEAAQLLAGVVAQVMGTSPAQCYSRTASSDRDGDGNKNDDYYGVLYGAHQVGVPGVILEHSFHTNTRAAQWLLDEENLRQLAAAEAQALAGYYGMAGFDDVPEDAWYAEAVRWAVGQGITEGIDERHFGPEELCTRAQVVSFLYRMSK